MVCTHVIEYVWKGEHFTLYLRSEEEARLFIQDKDLEEYHVYGLLEGFGPTH